MSRQVKILWKFTVCNYKDEITPAWIYPISISPTEIYEMSILINVNYRQRDSTIVTWREARLHPVIFLST